MILAVLVTFVAFWMSTRGRQALEPEVRRPEPPSASLAGFRADLFHLPDDPMLGFVEIPAGPFIMGSSPALDRLAYDNERWSATERQGRVDLPRFFIGRFEVTVAQYQAFLAATAHPSAPEALAAPGNHPVTYVTWTDALAYGRWLGAVLLESPDTPANLRDLLQQGWRFTLPSEAQWEKSARGTDGAIFPWGNRAMEDRANFDAGGTMPVGAVICPECNLGLADMSGNVWELTRSPYQPYPYDESDDGGNLGQDALWVMRGGSFRDGIANVRAAVRGGVDPGVRNESIGFRLVLSP